MTYQDFLELCACQTPGLGEKYDLFSSTHDNGRLNQIKGNVWGARHCTMLDPSHNILPAALPVKSSLRLARKLRRTKHKWDTEFLTYQGRTIKLEPHLREVSAEEKVVQELLGLLVQPAIKDNGGNKSGLSSYKGSSKTPQERRHAKADRVSVVESESVIYDFQAMLPNALSAYQEWEGDAA